MTRHFLPAEAQHRFDEARIAVIDRMAELVRSQNCGFVVVAGDAFESNHVSGHLVARALDALGGLPVPVYLLPGNHDPYDPASIYRGSAFQRHRPGNVRVLSDPEPIEAVPGVWLYPAPWLSKRPAANPCLSVLEALAGQPRPKGARRILVAHGALDVYAPQSEDPTRLVREAFLAAIAATGIDYVALGDRHSTTAVDTEQRVWYSGSPEATDFDEQDVGNVLIIELPEDGGPPVVATQRIGRWQFVAQRWSLDTDVDIDALAEWLNSLPNKRETVLKLSTVGTLSISQRARLDALLAASADLFAAIVDWDRQPELVVRSDDSDFEELGLSGFAATALADLRELAEAGDDQAPLARRALGLLWRLAQPSGKAG